MEGDDQRYAVRKELKGLRSRFGFRRYRLYFTDEKIFLVETYVGWAMGAFFISIPLKIILTPILAPLSERTYDKMEDLRYALAESSWYKRYTYDELKAVWIEPGIHLYKLVLLLEPAQNRPTYDNEAGEGSVYFRPERNDDLIEALEMAIPDKFMGVRED